MSIIHCQFSEVSIPITCSCQRAYFASGVLMGFEVNESMCLGGAARYPVLFNTVRWEIPQ